MFQKDNLKLTARKNGVPYGIRTRVAAVKGRCPRPLDEGDVFKYTSLPAKNSAFLTCLDKKCKHFYIFFYKNIAYTSNYKCKLGVLFKLCLII